MFCEPDKPYLQNVKCMWKNKHLYYKFDTVLLFSRAQVGKERSVGQCGKQQGAWWPVAVRMLYVDKFYAIQIKA